MEPNSVDSTVSSLTMMDEDGLPYPFSSITKLHNIGPTATSVHELLECPVCTNSMYPPIHQDAASSDKLDSMSEAYFLQPTRFYIALQGNGEKSVPWCYYQL